MHLSRIGLEGEGKILGTMALCLGVAMAVGAVMGAAGVAVRWLRFKVQVPFLKFFVILFAYVYCSSVRSARIVNEGVHEYINTKYSHRLSGDGAYHIHPEGAGHFSMLSFRG